MHQKAFSFWVGSLRLQPPDHVPNTCYSYPLPSSLQNLWCLDKSLETTNRKFNMAYQIVIIQVTSIVPQIRPLTDIVHSKYSFIYLLTYFTYLLT